MTAAPDYRAVLADLTRRRAELDAAIAAITPLAGTAPSRAAPARAAKPKRGRPAKPSGGAAKPRQTRGRTTPLVDEREQAIALAKQGKSVAQIAAALGLKYSSVWNWSQKPEWPKAA